MKADTQESSKACKSYPINFRFTDPPRCKGVEQILYIQENNKTHMSYKGTILLIGGGEYRGEDNEQESEKEELTQDTPLRFLYNDPQKAKIAIITTGTAYPRESFELYEKYFRDKGVKEVCMLDIDSRYLKDEHINMVKDATAVFIGGGNQRKILEILAGTELEKILFRRLEEDENFILGGTSAGAMIISDLTIGDGYEKKNLIKGDVDIRPGMNLLPGTIVDTHFIFSGRLARLSLALLENRDRIGIAVPENGGALIKEGNFIEAVGSEMVIIMDPSEITETNIDEAANRNPVYAAGMKMHFLNEGSYFSIKEKKLFRREKTKEKTRKKEKEILKK